MLEGSTVKRPYLRSKKDVLYIPVMFNLLWVAELEARRITTSIQLILVFKPSVIFTCLPWKLFSQFSINSVPEFKREWMLMKLKSSCEKLSSSSVYFPFQVTVCALF